MVPVFDIVAVLLFAILAAMSLGWIPVGIFRFVRGAMRWFRQ